VEVHKSFGRLHVLNGVSLDVKRGETVCIIGPSGSGKSTFLRCINHLEKIDSGRIEVNGQLIGYRQRNGKLVEDSEKSIARQRTQIGMVFQRFNLFPHKTALQNVIEAPIHVLRRPKEQAVAEGNALLERVGLADKRDVYPGKLSGGQQQRVAIARALVHDPKLIVCDEPTSALDHETGHNVMELLREVAMRPGRALIIVTHDARIFEFADRIARMDDGRIIDIAESRDAVKDVKRKASME
jgi:polar amino acid transport system ATP-binding protein